MEMNYNKSTCKCSEFAPLMSKYLNSGDDIQIVGRETFNPPYGHIPNYDRVLGPGNDGRLVSLVRNANDMQSIVKEGYTSPILLENANLKSGESKLVKLEIDKKTGEAKLVPLEVDPHTGEAKLVTLDIDHKTGQAQIVKLEVDEKTGQPKLVGLDVAEKLGEAKLVMLDARSKDGEVKLIHLDVDSKTRAAKLVPLKTQVIEGHSKLVKLEITEKSGEAKLINLKVDEKLGQSKMIILDVTDKSSEPKLVNLKVDKIEGKSKLVGLEVNPITGESKLIKLQVPELDGKSKLVKLEVNPLFSEPKLISLNVPELTGKSKLVELNVTDKSAEPKLVGLNVEAKSGKTALVELDTTDPRSLTRLSELDESIGYIKPHSVPEGSAKLGQSKLIMLDINEKTGEPKLVHLDVTPLTGTPKLVMLEVNPIIGEAKLIRLDVPELTGEAKLVMLDVDPKTGTPKLVMLEVDEKTKDPKLIELEVNEKTGQVKLVPLDVPELTGEAKIIKLDIDEKDGQVKIVDLEVPNIDLPEGERIELPEDYGTAESTSDKYTGDYIPGTTIPVHHRSANSMVESKNPDPSNDEEIVELDAKAIEKYSKTAAWMGIPGKIGLQAAADYESIMTIFDSMNYQLGGGDAAIERMKSYLTAAASGKGMITEAPVHSLEAGHIVAGSSVVRMANASIRGVMNKAGGGMTKILSSSLSALNGDITGALKSITASSGGAKAKAIHEALVLVNNLYSRALGKTQTRPDQLPGSAKTGNTISALAQGDLKGALNSAVSGAVGLLLGGDERDAMNAPSNKKDGLWEESYSKTWEDPKTTGGEGATGIRKITNALGITAGAGGGNYGFDSVVKSRSFAFKDRMKTPAMSTTLKELVSTEPSHISSLSDLRSALQTETSVITTFSHHLNVRDTGAKTIGNVGLDSNHNWEVTLEPLIDKNLNGGFTYLPTMAWINKKNNDEFNIHTGYGRWLPFTSFELQDKKLTSKSLNLFDGGITYPVSMEFTNELRLTLVDDQLKTFRRYFDTVAKVSTFSSNSYNDPDDSKDPGVYESSPEVASYKNVTFLCTIYVLNNEYATVKRCPLLVTLADYQLEYNGEIESGGNDLALHFSIVGELNSEDFRRISSYHKITSPHEGELFKAKVNNSMPSYTPKNPLAKISVGLI